MRDQSETCPHTDCLMRGAQMLRSKLILLSLIFCLLMAPGALAQDDGLKLTGWPYQVDVVSENLGRFTDQYGHGAEFLPFPSNEYHDKMVASFVAGTEFDVAYVRDSYLAEWASAGWIVPITGLEGADELLADLPQGIIEQMSYDGEVLNELAKEWNELKEDWGY